MREAYSRLNFLLEERQLNPAELRRRIVTQGDAVDVKTIGRLLDPDRPIKLIETRVADAVCRALGIQIGDLLAFVEPLAPQLASLSAEKQRRLHELMDRHTEEELAGPERAELAALVVQQGEIGLLNAQRILAHRERVRERRSARQHSAAD
jgi:DNA-binding Xre family transcriptional regulator